MLTEVSNIVQLDEKKSARRAGMTLRQEPFLKELEKSLKKDKRSVIAKFEALRTECRSVETVANWSD